MLPVHDEVASVVSLARTVLSGVDRRRLTTEVQTESLILLLNTLVALATPSVHQKVDDAAGPLGVDQPPRHFAAQHIGRAQIGVDHPVDEVERHFGGAHGIGTTGVVDEDLR